MKKKDLGKLLTAQMRRQGFVLARGLKDHSVTIECDDIFCPAEDFLRLFLERKFNLTASRIKIVGDLFFWGPKIEFDFREIVFPEVEILGSIQFKQMTIAGHLDLSLVKMSGILDFQTVFVGGELKPPANFAEMEKSAHPRVSIDRLKVVGSSHSMFKR